MKRVKMFLLFFLALVLTISISGCGKQSESPVGKTEDTEEVSVTDQSDNKQEETNKNVSATDGKQVTQEDMQVDKQAESMLLMRIGDMAINVEWEDNESVQALKELCSNEPLNIQMSMYGGFEQVGSLGSRLPSDDVQTTTAPGDIVLYSSNQLVIFYGSNSWAYTRLGHITDQDAAGLAEMLANGDVTIRISME